MEKEKERADESKRSGEHGTSSLSVNGSQLCTTKLQRASSYERFRPFNRDNGRPRDGTNFPVPKITMFSRERE